MNWFLSKRSTTVDPPTVSLTEAERDAFAQLTASYRKGRRGRRALAGWCRAHRVGVGSWVWGAGAVWIVSCLTTSPLLSALGAVPFVVGMRGVLVRSGLRRRLGRAQRAR